MTSGTPKKDDIVFTMEAPLGNAALIPDDKKIHPKPKNYIATNKRRKVHLYLYIASILI
jgi:hypothetical protein